MTIKELKELLEKFDENLLVAVNDNHFGKVGATEIYQARQKVTVKRIRVPGGEYLSNEITNVVVIE